MLSSAVFTNRVDASRFILARLRRATATCALAIAACLARSSCNGQDRIHLFEAAPLSILGSRIALAGDVDADGHPDILLGTDARNSGGHIARVYSGKHGCLLRFVAGANDREIGWFVGGVGDLNRDGHDDYLVSTGYSPSRAYSGKDGRTLFTWTDRVHDVLPAGDSNRDGFPDVWTSATGIERYNLDWGIVQLRSGKDGTTLFRRKELGSQLGFAIARIGGNLCVGDPLNDRVHLLSGRNGAVIWRWSSSVRRRYGVSVAGIADIDRDSIHDVLVGSAAGNLQILSGKSGKSIRQVNLSGQWIAVSSVGDVTGDGITDYAVGIPHTKTAAGPDAGVVEFRSGKDDRVLFKLSGRDRLLWFGMHLAGPTDFNRDGVSDILIGTCPSGQGGYMPVGYCAVHSGKRLALSADRYFVSLSLENDLQKLTLAATPARRGRPFLILGSARGVRPGFQAGSTLVPLNPDAYLELTLRFPNSPFLPNSLGVLDSGGSASAVFAAKPSWLALQGLVLDHAYVALQADGKLFASNAVPVTLR